MRLILLLVILAMTSFAAYEYGRIEAHYRLLEAHAMYIFNKCKQF